MTVHMSGAGRAGGDSGMGRDCGQSSGFAHCGQHQDTPA